MVRKATSNELAAQYLAAGQEVQRDVKSGGRFLSLDELNQRKTALLGDDGQELLNRLDYLRNLPQSAFGYKPPSYLNHNTIPRIEIVTTVVGSRAGSCASSLAIYLEADQCYVGYKNEEGPHSLGITSNFLVHKPRDKEGVWIDDVMMAVMVSSIKNGYSPKPEAATSAPQ
ncbi:MAG: hypothetical protein HGA87_05300 [Desulfobulbaceae bacterium]|nr:hypothetical protein [Desulfobulbaceae bacterium]